MNFVRTLFRFTKIEHTVFSLPIVFAGAYIGAGRHFPDMRTLALIALAAVGGRILGMSVNRILDRKIDALNDRTKGRDLPAGSMSLASALMIAGTGLAVYLAACVMLGPVVLMLSPVPAFFLIVYSLLKRFTWLCHYGIGVVLGMAPAAACVAAGGRIAYVPELALLCGFVFFWISGYDIIYALQDIDFDRKARVHSLPGRFGARTAQLVAAATHLAAFLLLVMFAFRISAGPWVTLPLCVCAVTMLLSYYPAIPLPFRFFPMSAIAGIAGAVVVYF